MSNKSTAEAPNLTEPSTYKVRVPGHINQNWSDWFEEVDIKFGIEDGKPFTDMIITIDQAGLQAFLQRVYGLGLPIISVDCINESII